MPEWTTVELGPLVRDARKILSPAELGVIRSAAGVLRDALAAAGTGGLDMRGRMGALESVARHGGFTDVLPRGTEADGHVTIEAAGEYRQSWLLTGRTYGDAAFLGSLADAQRAALAAIGPGVAWSKVEAAALAALALPDGATAVVTWSSQADFANRASCARPRPQAPRQVRSPPCSSRSSKRADGAASLPIRSSPPWAARNSSAPEPHPDYHAITENPCGSCRTPTLSSS